MPAPSSVSGIDDQILLDGLNTLYGTLGLVCQTLIYGIFVALTPYATSVIRKFRATWKIASLFLGLNMFMFLLSSGYWIFSIASHVDQLKSRFIDQTHRDDLGAYRPLYSCLILINFVFSDAMVVWRAFVICREFHKMLVLSYLWLVLTTLSVFAVIVTRIALIVTFPSLSEGHNIKLNNSLTRAIDVTQISTQAFSLLTNLTATGMIAWKLARYKRAYQKYAPHAVYLAEKSVNNVLSLLVESGAVFCVSATLNLVASFIHFPHGTLGDIYVPVHAQLAGMYPSLVFVLAHRRGRLLTISDASKTPVGSSGDQNTKRAPTKLDTMEFAPRSSTEFTSIQVEAAGESQTPRRRFGFDNV